MQDISDDKLDDFFRKKSENARIAFNPEAWEKMNHKLNVEAVRRSILKRFIFFSLMLLVLISSLIPFTNSVEIKGNRNSESAAQGLSDRYNNSLSTTKKTKSAPDANVENQSFNDIEKTSEKEKESQSKEILKNKDKKNSTNKVADPNDKLAHHTNEKVEREKKKPVNLVNPKTSFPESPVFNKASAHDDETDSFSKDDFLSGAKSESDPEYKTAKEKTKNAPSVNISRSTNATQSSDRPSIKSTTGLDSIELKKNSINADIQIEDQESAKESIKSSHLVDSDSLSEKSHVYSSLQLEKNSLHDQIINKEEPISNDLAIMFKKGVKQAADIQPRFIMLPLHPIDSENKIVLVKEKGKEDKIIKSKVRLSVLVSPDLSSVVDIKIGKPGYNTGFSMEYFILDRLSVGVSLLNSRKTYSASPDCYTFPSGNYAYKPDNIDGKCTVWDIPVNLRYYYYSGNKFKTFASLGMSSYFMRKESYQYEYPTYNKTYDYKKGNNHLFSVINLSIGAEYKLGKRFSIGIEPFAKIPTAGVGEGKILLNTIGAFLSINYIIISK